MATSKVITSPAQLSLFPCQGSSVKSNQNGRNAKSATISEYLKTRDALFRLLATYPPQMPVTEAVQLAKTDFTKCRKGGAA